MKITEINSIVAQMGEPQPLPMGRKEFDEWTHRIISGALIPDADGKVLQDCEADEKFYESQRFALAGLLMSLGPTESHKPDAYFIHALRVSAVKQVALVMGEEIRARRKAALDAQLKAEEDVESETTG